MHRERATDQNQRSDKGSKTEMGTQSELPRSEELHIRSYDHQWSYDLDVELVGSDGETVFQERYYLLPGNTESEVGIVPSGHYELDVILDNGNEETLACQIGSTLEQTAVIEVGNGALALSEGVQK
ncbi:MAG: hypothetical protein U5K70_02905 [Halodesulfurarchaeum sp.]|nr:hypothetical protein [Halodesulfurarchaeum sp.]